MLSVFIMFIPVCLFHGPFYEYQLAWLGKDYLMLTSTSTNGTNFVLISDILLLFESPKDNLDKCWSIFHQINEAFDIGKHNHLNLNVFQLLMCSIIAMNFFSSLKVSITMKESVIKWYSNFMFARICSIALFTYLMYIICLFLFCFAVYVSTFCGELSFVV